jgi:limonene-1,2-epoxide hydrolase
VDDAAAVLARYLKAQQDKDLDALVSCWHPAVEAVHPLRPDRGWQGSDTYRRQWARIWANNPTSRFEVVSSGVVGDRIYLEALVEHADGTMVPNMNILEVEDGKIRRARVYTDKAVRDGVTMDNFVRDLNPGRGTQSPGEPASTDAADAFFAALNEHDEGALERCLHPDFEMIVPQKPARGFKGREQELKNMRFVFETYPDFSVTVLRKAVAGNEIWTEADGRATGLEMAAVTIWEVDEATGTLIRGRYYSEPVQHDAPGIDEFMLGIGRPPMG